MTTPILRLQSIILQPVLLWDDGEELIPGPEIEPAMLPLSRAGEWLENLPGEIEKMNMPVPSLEG